MHPINVVRITKEDRGWKFWCDFGSQEESNLTCYKENTYIWFFHNGSGKYNEKPIIGRIMHFIRCVELGNRDIMIVLCENSIERYPVMLDSNYDIIGNSKKDVKNRARLCSIKYQLTKEILG